MKKNSNIKTDKEEKPPGKIKTAVKKFFHMKAGNSDGVLGSFITGVSGATFFEGIIKSKKH